MINSFEEMQLRFELLNGCLGSAFNFKQAKAQRELNKCIFNDSCEKAKIERQSRFIEVIKAMLKNIGLLK